MVDLLKHIHVTPLSPAYARLVLHPSPKKLFVYIQAKRQEMILT